MNEIELMRHIEWIIDKLKKSSTGTYYLETDWETLPRIITLPEAIKLRKALEKRFIMTSKKRITKSKRTHLFSPYSYAEDLDKITGISAKTWQNLQSSYECADSHFHRRNVKKMKKFLKKPRKNQDEVASGNLVRRYLELDSEIVRMLNRLDRKSFPAEVDACNVVFGSLNDIYTELADIMMTSTDEIEDDFEMEFHDGVRNVETLETESEKVSEGISVLREMAEGRHSYTETMNAVEFTMIHALRILCVLQKTVGEIQR